MRSAVAAAAPNVFVAVVLALGRGQYVVQPLGRVDGAVGALPDKMRNQKLDQTSLSFPPSRVFDVPSLLLSRLRSPCPAGLHRPSWMD